MTQTSVSSCESLQTPELYRLLRPLWVPSIEALFWSLTMYSLFAHKMTPGGDGQTGTLFRDCTSLIAVLSRAPHPWDSFSELQPLVKSWLTRSQAARSSHIARASGQSVSVFQEVGQW